MATGQPARRVLCLATALALCLATTALNSGECLDNNGKAVDWWFMYKLPGGYTFAYTDANDDRTSGQLQLYPYKLNDDQHPSALINTLRSLVTQTDGDEANVTATPEVTTPFFLYNDQPDNAQPSASYGHTKGVVAIGKSKSFWLLHSTPNFPSSDGLPKFYFPEGEITYGQTFLCSTVSSSQVDDIAGQFLYTHPFIYMSKSVDSTLKTKYPNLGKVFNNEWQTEAGTHVAKLSVGGATFTSLAKNAEWDDDLYEGLIAPAFKTDLVVESWLRGSKEGSYCKPKHPYMVVDVSTLQVNGGKQGNITWTEGQDHAKWALALDDTHLVCICDINRMTTQRVRGGGCICFKQATLASQLYGTVTSSYTCKR